MIAGSFSLAICSQSDKFNSRDGHIRTYGWQSLASTRVSLASDIIRLLTIAR